LLRFLLIVCFISAFLIYRHEKNLLEEIAYAKTEMVMAGVEASRAYVREELRPRMFAEFGSDFFMLEAMSTSYVGRAVMDRFGQDLPDFQYRRVSINARNPHVGGQCA
jgi:two-component system, NtrC family, sensor kinase